MKEKNNNEKRRNGFWKVAELQTGAIEFDAFICVVILWHFSGCKSLYFGTLGKISNNCSSVLKTTILEALS